MGKIIYEGNHSGYECTVKVIDEEAYKWDEPTAKLILRNPDTKEIEMCAPIFGKLPEKIEERMVISLMRKIGR